MDVEGLPSRDLIAKPSLYDAVVDDVVEPHEGETSAVARVGDGLGDYLGKLLGGRINSVLVEEPALARRGMYEPFGAEVGRGAARVFGAPDIREDGVPDRLFRPTRLAFGGEVEDNLGPVLLEDRSQLALGDNVDV